MLRGPDRHQNIDFRKLVENMTPGEQRLVLLHNEKSGLPNERALNEAEQKGTAGIYRTMIDLDNLLFITQYRQVSCQCH